MRYNGGVIGRLNAPLKSRGVGVWPLNVQADNQRANRWPDDRSLPITSNLILHIDASRASTITLNGSNVSSILDLSANPKTVDQTTAASQPEYITSAQNGRNALRFTSASQHFLNISSTNIPSSHTVFYIINRQSSGTLQFPLAAVATSRYCGSWHNDNIHYQNSNGAFTQHGTANTSTGWFYMTTRRNGTTQMRMRVNGSTVADVTSGTGITSAASGSWDCIGRFGYYYQSGDIGEIIVYDTNLSDSDVDSIESYLASKWNI